jgi:hypothetical protein
MKASSFLGLLLAWVLWSQMQNKSGSDWNPEGGFENRSQCIEALKNELDLWRRGKNTNVGGDAVQFKDKNVVVTYRCLPDTVDPRTRFRE